MLMNNQLNKYKLLELAEKKNIPSIYDLLPKLQVKKGSIACTDGSTIFIDPDIFYGLDPMFQFFILSHELLHILYKHHEMSPEEYPNRKLLNICQDVVINEYLIKRLRYTPPDGIFLSNLSGALINLGLIYGQLSYNGVLTTKQLYEYLSRNIRDNDKLDKFIDSFPNDIIDPEDYEDSVDDQILDEVRDALKITDDILSSELGEEIVKLESSEGGSTTKGAGTPATPSKVYSHLELVKFINKFVGTHAVVKGRSRTFTRLNRRVQSSDYVLKGYKNTKTVKEIVIYLDTSGSMSNQLIADLYNTLSVLYKTTKFRLFEFDYSLREVDMENDRLYSGGGTDISKVLRHIDSNKFDTAILITDCEDEFSLDKVKSDLLIFTNDLKFKSSNPKVKVSYFS